QILASELIKNHEVPSKKQKLDEYSRLVPYNMQIQQIYASLEPFYNPFVQDLANVNRHVSAFKPVPLIAAESNIRKVGQFADPPVLQHPEKVVPLSESEKFGRSYQPNVALVPPTPKKHLYGRNSININEAIKCDLKQRALMMNGHFVKKEPEEATPERDRVETTIPNECISTQRCNSEMDCSTDSDDSTTESIGSSSIKYLKTVLQAIEDPLARRRCLNIFKSLIKQRDKLAAELEKKHELMNSMVIHREEIIRNTENYQEANGNENAEQTEQKEEKEELKNVAETGTNKNSPEGIKSEEKEKKKEEEKESTSEGSVSE
ncbi:hypothetical protein WA026_010781, partial [Henosepilachna vigintioctopunctata]